MRVRLETRRSRIRPPRGRPPRQHSFVEIDHEIFSTVILSLPLFKEGHLSVSGERRCTILVNRLEDYACQVNVWLGKLTALDIIPLGWLDVKPQHKQTKGKILLFDYFSPHIISLTRNQREQDHQKRLGPINTDWWVRGKGKRKVSRPRLNMKLSLLMNMKMPKIVGIFIFISREIFLLGKNLQLLVIWDLLAGQSSCLVEWSMKKVL